MHLDSGVVYGVVTTMKLIIENDGEKVAKTAVNSFRKRIPNFAPTEGWPFLLDLPMTPQI